jgi:glycine/D-amino acid oxidase-like deaminating enzyme
MSHTVVLGSGIVGLWTALTLSERGHQVTVISPLEPSSTFSSAAAAVITPLLPWDHDHPSFVRSWGWYRRTIDRFRLLDSVQPASAKLLESMPSYECGFELAGERVLEKGFGLERFRHLPFTAVDVVELSPPVIVENHPGETHECTFCAHFVADFCNTERFLEFLRGRLLKFGTRFIRHAVRSLDDALLSDTDVVFNCMGFDSTTLFPDDSLYHVRGQSMFMDIEDDGGPYFGVASGHHAIFKHRHGVYLGSYFIEGEREARTYPAKTEYDYSLRFAATAYKTICSRLGLPPARLDPQRIRRVSTGIRPYRPNGPRIEVDRMLLTNGSGLRVIHNYGHGAHGWTIGAATSEDAVNLAETMGWMSNPR